MDVLDLKTCCHPTTKNLVEDSLVAYVRDLKPNLIVLSICYSQVSKIKKILEKTAVFAERRLERNIIAATNGKAIDLDKKQVELIYEVAKPENINKNVVIQGPEGSGKTLLGIEIVKLIANNYIYNENLSPDQAQEDIRVIFSACYNQPEEVDLWRKQVENIVERDKMKSSYEVKVEPIKARLEQTPKAYYGDDNLILELIRRNNSYGNYKKTIILIDELNPGFESSDWSIFQHFKCMGVHNVQIVFNLKYDFHDMKIRMKRNENDQSDYEEINILLLGNVLVGRLRKAHRCSNEIRNFVYYLLMHEFDDDDNFHKFKSFNHDESSFDALKKPIWIDTIDADTFYTFVRRNGLNRRSLFEKNPGKTFVLIYDPDTVELTEEKRKVKSICDSEDWKYSSKTEVVGSEFSTVIIYGLKEFHFEAFTRAINQLIIVTTASTR